MNSAILLGAGVSAVALPHGFAAEQKAVQNESAAEAALSSIAAQGPALTAAPATTSSDDRAAAWAAQRPAEDAVSRYLAAYAGKTVVEIKLSGATEATEGAARAALRMHVGDPVTEESLVKDRDAIYATGYFYDLYPSFEAVPEGVGKYSRVHREPDVTRHG